MKVGSYNIRGLGSDIKQNEIKSFFLTNSLDFCCVQETKLVSFSDTAGRSIWGSSGIKWCAVPSQGRSGGLLSFWDESKFNCISQWSMDGALVVNGRWCSTGENYCIVNVYAPCILEQKLQLWDRLSLLIGQNLDSNLCLIGDFNSILYANERVGSSSSSYFREMSEFQAFVGNCKLLDVPLQGRNYTWYRPNGTSKSRIDRALINERWASRWINTSLRGLKRSLSDHCPIVLYSTVADWGARPFRFINAWVSHPDFMKVVEDSWKEDGISGWSSFVFKEKLKRLKAKLKVWNQECFGLIDQNIRSLRDDIHALDLLDDASGLTEVDVIRRNEKSAHLLLQLNNRKSLLAQKAKLNWLKEGDINSKLFHKAIKARRLSNGITGLEVDGQWSEDPATIKRSISEYFRLQFQKEAGGWVEFPSDLINVKLEEADGILLTSPFTTEEIHAAVWDCDGSKSPGPDGFNLTFFRACWSIIKEDLLKVFDEFHSNCSLVRGSNSSFITLVPKREGACDIKHFRPISLIGSLYKVIAKVLVSRLKSVMEKIISETQSAFIKGRNILDGVIVLNEIIEEAKKKKKSVMIFKADFAKAFDSVNWSYLLDMMKKLNFPRKWLDWMKMCVSSATANVLVNGCPSGEFKLNRGIRQGDPLSPFLFLIAAEGLSLLTKKAISEGLLQAAIVGRQGLEVSHIQYADDTLFVLEGCRENAEGVKWLLKNFELISGLEVNFDKSSVFGINMERDLLEEVANVLQCRAGSLPIPYLGLKVGGRINGIDGWSNVVERVKSRLRKWDTSSISMGGRVTIINSILNAMPLYGMSFLPLPTRVANQLKSLQCNFLWGGNVVQRKMAWIKWIEICKSKKDGGLGVKNLQLFNKALLTKWLWRFLVNKESLWAQVIKARHGDLHPNRRGQNAVHYKSGWWPKVLTVAGRDGAGWFWGNLSRKLGNGCSISFWHDYWAGDMALKESFPRLYNLSANKDGSVRDMGRWFDGCWRWELTWRRALMDRELAQVGQLLNLIQNLAVNEDGLDEWKWGDSSSGVFTVKAAYASLLRESLGDRSQRHSWRGFNLIWKSLAPLKAQITAWRLALDRLPTKDNLGKRFPLEPDAQLCCGCRLSQETARHFLISCNDVSRLWNKLVSWIGVHWVPPNSIHDHFEHFANLLGVGKIRKWLGGLWICAIWVLWKWRNSIIFDQKDWDFKRVEEEIKCRFWSWCAARGEAVLNLSFADWSHNPLALFHSAL